MLGDGVGNVRYMPDREHGDLATDVHVWHSVTDLLVELKKHLPHIDIDKDVIRRQRRYIYILLRFFRSFSAPGKYSTYI